MSELDSSSYMNISEPSVSVPSLVENASSPENNEELDELPSESDSDDVTVSDDFDSDAEREWKESLQQLELLLSLVVIPYMGKYFGRKFAYWGWARFMEWKYPVEVVMRSKAEFRAVGAVAAAAL